MSKQSDAKTSQGYVPKAVPRTCCNCAHFKMDTVTKECFGKQWKQDTNLRCEIGGFAVKKMGTCCIWEEKNTLPANVTLIITRKE